MTAPLVSSAGTGQCGQSSLLGLQAITGEVNSENAELRVIPQAMRVVLMDRLQTEGVETASTINIDRSLYVRDRALLEAVSFADLMEVLASSLGPNAPSGLALFQDWWRTAAAPDPQYAADIGCTDTLINGFSYTCPTIRPRAEASLSKVADLRTGRNGGPPFTIIALVNRGDLVYGKQNPDTCGEYRVIAAADTLSSDATDTLVQLGALGQFYMSFEAALPNQGNGMCLAVQRFWNALANTNDSNARGMLRAFFLEEIGMNKDGTMSFPPEAGADFKFGPVISASNLGLLPDDASSLALPLAKPVGQIRTNTRDKTSRWLLRQYSFRRTSLGLRITPTSLSATPPVSIMVPESGCKEAGEDCNTAVGRKIAENVDGLKTIEFGKLAFELANICLEAGQMVAEDVFGDGYKVAIWKNETPDNHVFTALQTISTQPGLPDKDSKIAFNLEMTSCAGCHRHSTPSHIGHLSDWRGQSLGSLSPSPNMFTHSSIKCSDAACSRYEISPLLEKVFLPWRAFLMDQTLRQ
ncbi:hypothetical protein [Rhizobium herbae]|uniref:Cytochrome c domain-containing protein n=1 Tax=Rhizobium herbae TaxID=508661 RepID=A0ABS4EUB8_9HYPH|nr:hypothetical protein [Rhizobium herbae]MBP1861550.1 hypothetical protein [Rhizobium herbae]